MERGRVMRRQLKRTALFFPLVFVIISCVTINVYFPAAAVEKAADKIVEDVWGGVEKETPPAKDIKDEGTEGRLDAPRSFSWIRIGTPSAEAAGSTNINVSTPAIRALKESIRSRAYALKPFMNRGNIGIGRDGLIVALNRNGLNLREKAALARLVKAENKDRMALYREIAKANGISSDRVGDIKGLFSKSWIKGARKGWHVQAPDGSWRVK